MVSFLQRFFYLLSFCNLDCGTATGSQMLFKFRAGGNVDSADAISLGVIFPMGIRCVLVNSGGVFACGQEAEVNDGIARIIVGDCSYKPVV